MLFAGIANRPNICIRSGHSSPNSRTASGYLHNHAQTAAHVEALDINARLMRAQHRNARTRARADRDIANVRAHDRWKCNSCRLSRRPASRRVSPPDCGTGRRRMNYDFRRVATYRTPERPDAHARPDGTTFRRFPKLLPAQSRDFQTSFR